MPAHRMIGAAAAFLTMLGFLPQVVKTFKAKSVKDVSLFALVQFAMGVTLWAIYGVFLKDVIIIIANIVTLVTLIIMIFFYFYYLVKVFIFPLSDTVCKF